MKYWPGTAHWSDNITDRAAGKFKKGNRQSKGNYDSYFASLSKEERHELSVRAAAASKASPNRNIRRFTREECIKGAKASNAKGKAMARRAKNLEKWGLEPDEIVEEEIEIPRIDLLLNMAPVRAVEKPPSFLSKKPQLWK